MSCTPTFVDHALDLLSSLGPVDARRMFGGYGIYARGVMFGLLDDDELFLKTDDESRGVFVSAGCRMWVYPGAGMGETNYHRPPDEAHEDAEAMAPWARLGLEAALRRRAAKAAKGAATAARKAAREAKAAAARGASRGGKAAATRRKPAKVRRPAKARRPAARTGRGRTR